MAKGIAGSQAYRWGAAALFLAAFSILTALGFEFIGGQRPCPLCLEQRWAYYIGVPALFLTLVLLSAGRPKTAAILFALVALGFLANAGLGVFHAGVEWGFWPGPSTCSGSGGITIGNMADILKNNPPSVVRCDAPSGRFLGLSFAGWNVLACLSISTACSKAALQARDHETYL